MAAVLRARGAAIPANLSDYTPSKVEALTGIPGASVEKAAALLASAKVLSTLFGGLYASSPDLAAEVLPLLDTMKQRRVLVLHEASNAAGLLGAGAVTAAPGEIQESVRSGKVKTLVVAGVSPETAGLTAADLDSLHLFASFTTVPTPLETEKAEVLLPMAAWTEREGSFVSLTGQLLRQPKGALPYGDSRSLVRILSNLSRKMNANLPAVESALRR